jgi:sulfite oxidase
VEPYWNKWAIHFQSKQVTAVLEENKIGILPVCVLAEPSDEYALDPARGPQRRHHDFCCTTPAASQTHAHSLRQHFLTPNEVLYIRSHAPVPNHLSADSHDITFSLSRDGMQENTSSLSIQDLREQFGTIDVISVMQCAGNRQIDDFQKSGPNGFTGTPFQSLKSGMMGNTLYSGVRLDMLLRALFPVQCQQEEEEGGIWHVVFGGADGYESSSPLGLVLQAETDGLLAFEMNGDVLLPDHGYPVRVVLPGIAGARSVKWLESVTLSTAPSDAPWNAHYYRNCKREHIQKLPLNSIILSPDTQSVVQLREDGSGSVSVQGVAYSGGENTSIRGVDVTADGGKSWVRARLLAEEREAVAEQAVGDHSWVRFVAEVPVAVDVSGGSGSGSGSCSCDNNSCGSSSSSSSSSSGSSSSSSGSSSSSSSSSDSVNSAATHTITVHSRATDSSGTVQPEGSGAQRSYIYSGWGVASLTAMLPRRP